MSARSFRSVFMVASCAGAALGCYLVSLNVASERAALEEVETKIVLAQRDIRLLPDRDRHSRPACPARAVERPGAQPFGAFGRPVPRRRVPARAARPARAPDQCGCTGGASLGARAAPQSVPLVEGERPDDGAGATPPRGAPVAQLMREASLKLPERRPVPAAVKVTQAPRPPVTGRRRRREGCDGFEERCASQASKSAPRKVAAASKKAPPKVAAASKKAPPKVAAAANKAGDNKAQAGPKAVTKPVRTANLDPLAPLGAGPGSGRKNTTAR